MFEQAGKFLTRTLNRARISQQVEAVTVLNTANEWLRQTWGEPVLEYARPLYVKNHTLVIATVNAGLASEIRLRTQALLEHVSQHHGQMAVTAVRVEL